MAAQTVEAEVGRALDGDHLHPRLQHVDEGHEQLAVEAVLVQLVRRPIGGRHHRHTQPEQPIEQPAQDHRVGDVADLELVET
jgi:hypothetical protein